MAHVDAILGSSPDVPFRRVPCLVQLPRREARSSPHWEPAPLAVTTDSGMSSGPWNAPLMKTPGRVVCMGLTGLVLQKP